MNEKNDKKCVECTELGAKIKSTKYGFCNKLKKIVVLEKNCCEPATAKNTDKGV